MPSVTTSLLAGRTLLGRARGHSVLTDRPEQGGGGDAGCTSGELLLLAIGSCVVGNVARCAAERDIALLRLHADVRIDDMPQDGGPGDDGYAPVEVEVEIAADLLDGDLEALRAAAGSGRVTGRVNRNTDVRIRLVPVTGAGMSGASRQAPTAEAVAPEPEGVCDRT